MALPRILASLAAAACLLALREIMQLQRGPAGGSVGLILGAAATGLALITALGLALAPRSWWTGILDAGRSIHQRLLSAEAPLATRHAVALLGVGAVTSVLMLTRYLSLPQDPWDDDQGAFLITAGEIHDAGGLPWLAGALLSGEFAEANRHPLYLALLSLQPAFRGGQLLSAAIGVLGLMGLTVVLGRRRGWDVAGLFAVLLATNAAFCQYSSSVVCDILMLVLGGGIWLLHMPSRRTDPERHDGNAAGVRGGLKGLRVPAAAGVLLGLAWLTKGTGLVLLAGYLLWIVAMALMRIRKARRAPIDQAGSQSGRQGARPLRTACVWTLMVLIAFAVVGSPLLIRNVKRFGNPFYNVNSLLLFADHYDEFEPMLQQGLTTGDAARAWLATHTVSDIARREASGLVWELDIILRSLGPAPLDDARLLSGVPLALLAAVWMATRRSAADGLLLAWGIVCWGTFAWYVPIAAGERFILPLLAPILATAAEAIVRLVRSSRAPRGLLPLAASIWATVWTISMYAWGEFP